MARSVFRFEGLAPVGGTRRLTPESEGAPVLIDVVDRDVAVEGDGLANVIEAGSGRAAAVNPAGISAFFGTGERFDLRSGIFAAVRADELTLTVRGFRDGVEVVERSFRLDQDADRLVFGAKFRDLDFVEFEPSNSFSGDIFNPLGDNFFAVDNLAVRIADSDPLG